MFHHHGYEKITPLDYHCDEVIYLRVYTKDGETLRQFAVRMYYEAFGMLKAGQPGRNVPTGISIKQLNMDYHSEKQYMSVKNAQYRNRSHNLHDLLRECCSWHRLPCKDIVFANVR